MFLYLLFMNFVCANAALGAKKTAPVEVKKPKFAIFKQNRYIIFSVVVAIVAIVLIKIILNLSEIEKKEFNEDGDVVFILYKNGDTENYCYKDSAIICERYNANKQLIAASREEKCSLKKITFNYDENGNLISEHLELFEEPLFWFLNLNLEKQREKKWTYNADGTKKFEKYHYGKKIEKIYNEYCQIISESGYDIKDFLNGRFSVYFEDEDEICRKFFYYGKGPERRKKIGKIIDLKNGEDIQRIFDHVYLSRMFCDEERLGDEERLELCNDPINRMGSLLYESDRYENDFDRERRSFVENIELYIFQ